MLCLYVLCFMRSLFVFFWDISFEGLYMSSDTRVERLPSITTSPFSSSPDFVLGKTETQWDDDDDNDDPGSVSREDYASIARIGRYRVVLESHDRVGTYFVTCCSR